MKGVETERLKGHGQSYQQKWKRWRVLGWLSEWVTPVTPNGKREEDHVRISKISTHAGTEVIYQDK